MRPFLDTASLDEIRTIEAWGVLESTARAVDEIFEEGIGLAAVAGNVVEAARLGADVATMPCEVFEKLVQHPLTDSGLERFLSDWRKLREELTEGA